MRAVVTVDDVAFIRRVFRCYGIRVRITQRAFMPKAERWFADVHYNGAKRTLHQADDRELVESLWHELGHCIIADEACRAGINWCEPYPAWVERVAKKAAPTKGRNAAWVQNETAAVDASVAAALVFQQQFGGSPDLDKLQAYVNGDIDTENPPPEVLCWVPMVRRALDDGC